MALVVGFDSLADVLDLQTVDPGWQEEVESVVNVTPFSHLLTGVVSVVENWVHSSSSRYYSKEALILLGKGEWYTSYLIFLGMGTRDIFLASKAGSLEVTTSGFDNGSAAG